MLRCLGKILLRRSTKLYVQPTVTSMVLAIILAIILGVTQLISKSMCKDPTEGLLSASHFPALSWKGFGMFELRV